MSSEFLIAVSHELSKQENKGRKVKILDEGYTNNHLEQKLSLSVPEFSYIRNFPFNKNMQFCDMRVPNHTASKRHTLDDELDTRHPKLIKLRPEFTNYRSEAAVDMVDAVRSQVIKNDVILGEMLENPSINKNERTDALAETSLEQLTHETLDTSNSAHISVETIGGPSCATIEDGTCSDRKSSDQQEGFSKMETEKIQNGNENYASLVTGQDCVTEPDNLLLNTEKRVFFAHEFVGAETEAEADEYHSVHDSFSLSEFLISPASFEQKESCDALLHPIQEEEEEASDSRITAAVDVSTVMERMDTNVMFQCESEISGHASTSFALDSKSDGKRVGDGTEHPFCETEELSHSAEEGTHPNLSQNKISDSMVVTLGQTMVKEEFPIKQEVEEDPILHTIQVPSVDLLHNRELDLVDDTVFQNWFMSLVNQEMVPECVSASTYGHHESSDAGHSKDLNVKTAQKENLASVLAKSAADVEPHTHTKNVNEIIERDLPLPDLIGETGCVQVADHYVDRTQNSNEENDTHKFLQTLFPDAAYITPTQKTDTSFEKMKNACEELLPTDLNALTLPRTTQIPTTNIQTLKNKPDFAAVTESDTSNSAKPESDIIHKHHKKELIKKFSSDLRKCDMSSSRGNRTQTETSTKDSAPPSTSAAVTKEDKCVKDCIVISDSDDDSIIEFDIVKTCSKKRYTKSSHGGSLGKNTQSNNRKCTRSISSPSNAESLGQQAGNTTVKGSGILEYIVLSDSDDESSKPPVSSNNRASNCSDEYANISDAESRVSVSEVNRRNRTESHGVIDLSGGRSPTAMSKSSSAASSLGDSSSEVRVTAFAAGDSQCNLADRLGAHNSGLDTNNSNSFTHIVAATITYNPPRSNFGRESNGGDVIDLSRRNLTPLVASWQNKTNSALDVLDLSGSDKKHQERRSVIKSVGSATENKSATKDIAEDKDSSPAWSCPICFESLLSGQSVSSTQCGHVFCTKCIEEAVNQFKKCPTCCRRVSLKRVHKIFL